MERPILTRLRGEIWTVLEAAVPRGSRVALLGVPCHGNIGDAAIWQGTRLALSRLGCEVVATASRRTYSAKRVRAALREGDVVLLAGGGSFGDLWPGEQRLRERVLGDLADHRVVQLPQTLCFRTDEGLARAAAATHAHPDLIMLWRDLPSLELARERFGGASVLCPDLALLISLPPGTPGVPIVWLRRNDGELLHEPASGSGVRVVDWDPHTQVGKIAWAAVPLSLTLAARLPVPGHDRWGDAAQVGISRWRVAKGRRMLSAGQLVVTDRLHGHILCILLGKQHVILNTLQGKLFNFHQAWTRDDDLVHTAGTPAEALDLARSLL